MSSKKLLHEESTDGHRKPPTLRQDIYTILLLTSHIKTINKFRVF